MRNTNKYRGNSTTFFMNLAIVFWLICIFINDKYTNVVMGEDVKKPYSIDHIRSEIDLGTINSYENAINMLNDLIGRNPKDDIAYKLLGIAYIKLHQIDKNDDYIYNSIEHLKKTILLNPNDLSSKLILLEAYIQAKEFELAIKYMESDKGNSIGLEVKDSIKNIINKTKIKKNEEDIIDIDNINMQIDYYNDLREKDPSNVEYLLNLVKNYLILKKHQTTNKYDKKIEIHLSNVINIDSNVVGTFMLYGEYYSLNKQYNKATEHYQEANDVMKYLSNREKAIEKEKLDNIMAEHQKYSDQRITENKERLKLYHSNSNKNEYKRLISELNNNPEDDTLNYKLAHLCWEMSGFGINDIKVAESVKFIKQALKIKNDIEKYYILLIRIYEIEREYEKAEKVCQQALEVIESENVSTRLNNIQEMKNYIQFLTPSK